MEYNPYTQEHVRLQKMLAEKKDGKFNWPIA